MMKTVAFIPIKLNNERAPGKNIKKLGDELPLICFVQNTLIELKKEGVIDEVYVYCSDSAICEYLLEGVIFLRRPVFLDDKSTLGTQIYEEFVKDVSADYYVLAHATSPFVTKEHIKECVTNVRSGMYDSAFCAKKIQNFLWKNGAPMNFELSSPPRTQDMQPIYMELSTPYVFTREGFMQFRSRSGVKPYICECSEIEAIDIDYPEDFALADAVYCHILKDRK